MLTRKNRKIKNQEAMIENRNILISDMKKQAEVLYQEKKQLEIEKEEQKELINRIKMLVTSNKYNNEKAVLNKIKELISDYHDQN